MNEANRLRGRQFADGKCMRIDGLADGEARLKLRVFIPILRVMTAIDVANCSQ